MNISSIVGVKAGEGKTLHSLKRTWSLKIGNQVISQPSIFRGYVSFREVIVLPFCIYIYIADSQVT